jgi:hypothetical protein
VLGVPAEPSRRPELSGRHPRSIANQAICDIERAKANFDGHLVSFEPYVRIIRSGRDNVVGMTLLLSSYPDLPVGDSPPDVCLRFCRTMFNDTCADPHSVVRNQALLSSSDLPLVCRLSFLKSSETSIPQLMRDTSDGLMGGVRFSVVDRSERYNEDVSFFFCDGLLAFEYRYFPGSHLCPVLERLVDSWMKLSRSVGAGYNPIAPVEITYRESLWESRSRLPVQ